MDTDAEYDNEYLLENEEAEVIDVEEEGNEDDEIFPYDEEFFKQKLREKPQLPPGPTECGTSCPQKSYKDFKLPVGDRLSLDQYTSLDLLKQRIPYPQGCVPPLALPSWHFMPLERKIPLLQSPKDMFYYTRGKLAQKLYRKSPVFCLLDPYNRERVLRSPYSTLHDPCVKSLLYSPLMHSLLYKRGFINEYNDVLCSLGEFNEFRDYLRTLYCDQISEEVNAQDTFIKCEREQLRMLLRAESQTEGREAIAQARIAAAKKFQDDAIEIKRQKQRNKDQMTEARLRQWRNEKERKLIEHILFGSDDARKNRDRLQALYDLRLQERRDIMTKTTRKVLETEERLHNDKAMMQAAYNKFLLEWIESKYVFCYEKLFQRKQMREDLREEMKYKARRRQLRLEKYREQMPSILEKKKAEAARILAIVRKFAMRWLDRVRARLNAPKDVKHESCWIGQSKNILDDTVKYLRQESGYEKLDDFILNIMKLKKQIQHQIEMEEAEEAAAAMAQLAADEEETEANE